MPTFIEFCSGCGGLSTAFIQSGFQPIFLNDIDRDCCDTLRANYPEVKIKCKSMSDIHNLKRFRGLVDVVIGGMPCQSYSIAGKRKGLDDSRGKLMFKFVKAIQKIRPKVFMIENVKGLVNHDGGKTLKIIIGKFTEQYNVSYQVLNAVDFNVPQKRERVFIIGVRKDIKQIFEFPSKCEKRLVLKDVITSELARCSECYKYPDKLKELLKLIPAGGCWVNLPEDKKQEYMGKSLQSGGGKRGILRKLSLDEPCLTLLTSPHQKQTCRCHPTEIRPFNVAEYMAIQTFPETYKLIGSTRKKYMMIGNAVPVNLGKAIALQLINIVKNGTLNIYNIFMKRLKLVDLFCGTGAFTLAFEITNRFKCVFANDISSDSKHIYNQNFEQHMKRKDIHKIDIDTIPPHDILCAGFSCQAFSISGKRLGFKDKRSDVIWKVFEIIEQHMPKIILFENVKNFVSHDNGNTFKTVKYKLEDIGYHIKHAILNTSDLTGIPQHRERVYIIGFLDSELYNKFEFDFEHVPKQPISDFLKHHIKNKYYYSDRYKMFNTIKDNVVKHINENVVYQYRRYYVRENKKGEVPTLTANMGSGGHNVPLIKDDTGIRKLLPRECFNLQGFPRDYKIKGLSDSALYRLAGNAITVPIARLIADKLVSII
ncbi:Modification methylase MthTI [uncultured archaeon]|nr:Modification methylase MthTI [uncultured archaeon]